MDAIIQFIYLGEVTFHKERKDDLLSAARSLEIKELCKALSESCDLERSTVTIKDEPAIFYEERMDQLLSVTKSSESESTYDPEDEPSSCDMERPSKKLKEQAVVSDDIGKHEVLKSSGGIGTVGSKYICEQCQKIFCDRTKLNYHHIQSVHRGVKYACDQCDYQSAKPSNLNRHIQSRHEGVRYPCNQCYYKTADKGNLNKHIQARHDGGKYACEECDYKAAQKRDFKAHIESKHEGVLYFCDQCDYKSTTQRSLGRHIESKH